MGECPDWYYPVRASRYCAGVKPWEWVGLPFHLMWLEWVLAAEYAEAAAQEQRQRAHAPAAPRRR